ncbi:Cys-tRNA(Pro) deacylase [Desulfobacterales bacterium HSG17]|nr:Cys-tRNA(Pro) deacylase [Desulfobacterales bacterium HSG17]
MTPAINYLKKAKIRFKLHKYDHDSSSKAYGEEAAEKLKLSFDLIFKTLVVEICSKNFVVAIVPVSKQLDLKAFAKAVSVKKVNMAYKKDVEQATGYILGGVSPIAQKKKLKTIIDSSALKFKSIYVSAGRRGLQIELSPDDLCAHTSAAFNKISR